MELSPQGQGEELDQQERFVSLTEEPQRSPCDTRLRKRDVMLFLVGVLIASAFVGLVLALEHGRTSSGEYSRSRNLVVMVSDGFGPASATLARQSKNPNEGLALDSILVGTSRTHSVTNLITDSAAGGTAIACGKKTFNGGVAVDSDGKPLGTLLEAARTQNKKVGLVVTSHVSHATPACFSSHVTDRHEEMEIAAQQADFLPAVLLGGGRKMFLPIEKGGGRTDGRDLLEEMARRGARVLSTPSELEALDIQSDAPVVGLFAEGHMDFEIDRDASQPSLTRMVEVALQLLQRHGDGFALLIEGSRIDHAAHDNDPAAQLGDALEYDTAVQKVLDFAREDGETLVVSVSDHSTGGITVGADVSGTAEYQWYPDVLHRVSMSAGKMAALYASGTSSISNVLNAYAGITDLTQEEEDEIHSNAESTSSWGGPVRRRARIGYTTHGHTGVDVNLYAFGPHAEDFRGNHDNTDVGNLAARTMGFDLAAETTRLRARRGVYDLSPCPSCLRVGDVYHD